MAYSVRNVIVGAAALYVSTGDSGDATYATPDFPVPATPLTAGEGFATLLDAGGEFDTDWRHTGFTTDGLELTYAPDYTDIEVDQLLDSAKIFKTSLRVTLGTTLSEATLENLLLSWGQGGDPAAPTDEATATEVGIASGGLGDEPIEHALIAIGPAPRTPAGARRERVYYARRVLSVESSAHSLRRNEATVFPVSFRLLPDPTQPVGREYGTIRDRTV